VVLDWLTRLIFEACRSLVPKEAHLGGEARIHQSHGMTPSRAGDARAGGGRIAKGMVLLMA
jgi:hypothetical protein